MKKCILCGSKKFYPFFKNTDKIKICSCGLVFYKDIPTENAIKKSIRSVKVTELSDSPIERRDCYSRLKKLGKYKHGGKLLDIGTGAGNFLTIAKKYGWGVYGNDIVSSIIEIQRKRGHKMVDIEDIPNNSMDAITMYHVLEHIPNPIKFLSLIRRKLRVGGIIYIDVPNISGLGVRVFKEKSSYIMLNPPKGGHIFYYNSNTLIKLLKKTGFEVAEIGYKGGAVIQQVADVKERITGSRGIESWFIYAKPFVLFFMMVLSFLRLSDSIEVIAIKNRTYLS